MASPLAANLDQAYQSEVTSFTQLLWAKRIDGQIFGFTTMNRAVPYDDGRGPFLYNDGAAAASALNWKEGIEQFDEMQISVLIDGVTVTREDLRDNLWRGAEAIIYEVDWSTLVSGEHNILIAGWIQRIETKDNEAIFKVRSLRSAYDVVTRDLGFTVGAFCNKVFGGVDGNCGYPLLPPVWTAAQAVTAMPDDNTKVGDMRRPTTFMGYDARCIRSGQTGGIEPVWPAVLDGTIDDPDANGAGWQMVYARTVPDLLITSVASQSDFTVAGTGLVMPDGFFQQGLNRFETVGQNVGLPAIEVKRYTAATGRVQTALPARRVLAINDGVTLVGGCLHTTVACTGHGNYLNGLYTPLAPTADQVFEILRG